MSQSIEDTGTVSAALLACALLLASAGCGASASARPADAKIFSATKAPVHTGVWTTQDKIAAIEKAPISADQKKAAIAKVKSGQL